MVFWWWKGLDGVLGWFERLDGVLGWYWWSVGGFCVCVVWCMGMWGNWRGKGGKLVGGGYEGVIDDKLKWWSWWWNLNWDSGGLIGSGEFSSNLFNYWCSIRGKAMV